MNIQGGRELILAYRYQSCGVLSYLVPRTHEYYYSIVSLPCMNDFVSECGFSLAFIA